jgi:DNA-binding PadR family transcriptional regulator
VTTTSPRTHLTSGSSRLEIDGLVTSSWAVGDAGPGRTFFHLTDAGEQH